MDNNKILLIGLFGMLSINIVLPQVVFAFTANEYAVNNASADGDYIIRVGNYVFICSANSVTVAIQAITNLGTTSQTLTGLSTGCGAIITYDSKVYTMDATTTAVLREWALVGSTWVSTSRTVNIGAGGQSCQIGTDLKQQVTSDGFLFCSRGGTSDTYIKVNLNTMAIVFTSTNLNTQDSCNEPSITVPNLSTGYTYVFIRCSDRINTYSEGTNTLIHSLALANPNRMCVTQDTSLARILITRSSSTFPIYLNYTTGVGFTTITATVTTNDFPTYCSYDGQGKRFLVHASGIMSGLNITNASVIFSQGGFVGVNSLAVGRPTFWYYDTTYIDGLVLAGGGTTDTFFLYNMEGLPFGSGGTAFPDEDPTGGIDCSLPANINLLICRLTSGEQPTGTVLPNVGILITGNLNNITCALLPIDCDANPDIRTNGVGYIYSIVAFAIMLSIFFVASYGNLNKIPTFIWFISAIALLGALVAINFLDPTFLIVGIIIIVAMAAMQVRNSITKGIDFGSGEF